MEERKDYDCCSQSGTGSDQNVNTALFTAGIVLLMVCLKRASLFFLVEQWRAWVFLLLNIVLLAIFFTSMNPNSSQISDEETSKKNDEEMKEEKKKKKKRENCNEVVEACKEEDNQMQFKSKKRSKSEEEEEEEEEKLKPEKEEMVIEEENFEQPHPKLSKEELNERVEAFIAMFRQHLALDARKGRHNNKFYNVERKQVDHMKKKHVNLSSDGVNCFVLKVQG